MCHLWMEKEEIAKCANGLSSKHVHFHVDMIGLSHAMIVESSVSIAVFKSLMDFVLNI